LEGYIRISEAKEDIENLIIEIARFGWTGESDEDMLKKIGQKYGIEIDLFELGIKHK
jgi:hypothetical protein